MSTAAKHLSAPVTPRIDAIEDQARVYASARARLAEAVTELEDELRAIRAQRIGEIKSRVHAAGGEQSKLRQLLAAHPELFAGKHRTVTVDGVKVGYRKQRGKVVIADEAATIKRIRERLPADQAELLIKVSERVHKPAVYDLIAADLKRLGITIEDDADVVVVKPVDGEVDKLVDRLLAEYADE